MKIQPIQLAGTFKIQSTDKSMIGHFPGHPICPGVLQLQYVCDIIGMHYSKKVCLTKIEKTKFLSLIIPPQELHIRCEIAGAVANWEVIVENSVASRGRGTFEFIEEELL